MNQDKFSLKDLRKELEKELENTTGNLDWLYTFLTTHDLYRQLDIRKYLTSKSRLQNYINNLISAGAIQSPEKSGRSNRFEEKNILQILLTAKYMAYGAIRENIAGHFKSFKINDYYDHLFAKTIPDGMEVIGKSKKTDIKKIKLSEANLYHRIRVGRGLTLQVKFDEYELEEIEAMRNLLEDYISGTSSNGQNKSV